ncbi:TIM-barrel domain-containing protein [Bacteroides intestinalis]|jgi:alpha-D-xyloside xylohydrolase|uniref:glycoside hydrolase family 31 protein n=1 Tax=Bacteroides intestinalis TaxID=329854 RepID=UPI0022E6ED76|nr:TIM-barrel domain-containing protein [Bacteroides intestinalis]
MNMKFYLKISSILVAAAFLSTLPVEAQTFRQTKQGITGTTQGMDIEIQFVSPEIVRVVKAPEGRSFTKKSLSVVKSPESMSVTTEKKGETVSLKSNAVRVDFNVGTGRISFFDKQGKALFTEKDYGAQFTPFNDAGNPTFSVRQAFLLDKDEAIYGLGQQQVDDLNQRNHKHFMRQRALYASVPIIQSTKGYGMFWDNYSPTTYTDNPQEMSFDSEVGECMDYYFMYGGNADGVIAQIRDLTGQAPMYPLWTFGFWQSRERYKSQQETMEVVDKYRELGIPLDGIIQDWQYWGPNSNWNSMNFDNPEFPDPQKMIDHVKKKNAKIMISIWASFGPDTNPYKDLEKINALFNFKTWPADGGVKAYDAYNEKARDIYWEHLNKGLFSKGIDAWWTDSTEPDHLDVQERDFDIPTAMGTYRSVVNAFPLMSNKGVYEHQRAVTSDKRVYLLTRCAFAGQQRYAANTWSGDVVCNWETFRKQIPTGLNFSLSGIPYWNTDIGGFFNWPYHGGAENKAYHELYTRWFQYGTFLPMQRSHGSGVKKEIYNLGKKGDWVYDSEEKYINLRYALLPYLYSTGWQVTDNAGSFLRALFMDFNEDQKVHTISNQYMFGKAFLVTPVTKNMYVFSDKEQWKDPYEDFSKTGTQDVYLPKGTKWFDFWTGEALNGGQMVTKEVPIDIIPLYVRAGSIVPFGPKVQYSTEKKWNNLEIRIYPGADGEFVLYEDENDNYNYEKGAYSIIKFTWDDAKRTLNIADREGTFPGMLKSRKFNIVVVDKENGTGSVQSTKFTKSVSYGGKKKSVKL